MSDCVVLYDDGEYFFSKCRSESDILNRILVYRKKEHPLSSLRLRCKSRLKNVWELHDGALSKCKDEYYDICRERSIDRFLKFLENPSNEVLDAIMSRPTPDIFIPHLIPVMIVNPRSFMWTIEFADVSPTYLQAIYNVLKDREVPIETLNECISNGHYFLLPLIHGEKTLIKALKMGKNEFLECREALPDLKFHKVPNVELLFKRRKILDEIVEALTPVQRSKLISSLKTMVKFKFPKVEELLYPFALEFLDVLTEYPNLVEKIARENPEVLSGHPILQRISLEECWSKMDIFTCEELDPADYVSIGFGPKRHAFSRTLLNEYLEKRNDRHPLTGNKFTALERLQIFTQSYD